MSVKLSELRDIRFVYLNQIHAQSIISYGKSLKTQNERTQHLELEDENNVVCQLNQKPRG